MFYAVTGALLGSYEAATLVHPRLPRVSSLAARKRTTRVVAVAWALGLAVHLATHANEPAE